MRDLHIVATCTDRKALAPHADLRLRSLSARPNGAPDVDEWIAIRESVEAPAVPADSLYQGELWTETIRVCEAARTSGRRVTLWISSAGYGLVRSDVSLKSYAATFTPGARDSVTRASSSVVGSQRANAWWRALLLAPTDPSVPSSMAELAQSVAGDELLIVMSAAYLTATSDDLVEALQSHEKAVLISAGASDDRRYATSAPPFDARVQGDGRPLSGTRTSLNVRVARYLLGAIGTEELEPASAGPAIGALMAGLKPAPPYDRKPASDREVITFIRSVLRRDPTAGHTAALREFRDVERRACEQKRFAGLFKKEKAWFAESTVKERT